MCMLSAAIRVHTISANNGLAKFGCFALVFLRQLAMGRILQQMEGQSTTPVGCVRTLAPTAAMRPDAELTTSVLRPSCVTQEL